MGKKKAKKRVFIIGAGMSAECGAPVLSKFLTSEFTKYANRQKINLVKKFIKSVYPIKSQPNIEELLSLVDYSIIKREPIGRYTVREIQVMKEAIIDVITDILINVQKKLDKDLCIDDIDKPYFLLTNDKEEMKNLHKKKNKRFIEYMFSMHRFHTKTNEKEGFRNTYYVLSKNLNEDDVMLNFNYDLFLDDALGMMSRWAQTLGVPGNNNFITIDYGMDHFQFVSNLDMLCSGGPLELKRRPRYVEKGEIIIPHLKLHGSLNWAFCNSCKSILTTISTPVSELHKHIEDLKNIDKDLRGMNKINIRQRYLCCPEFSIEPLIVPPTWEKDYTNKHLEEIWTLAKRHISIADELIFLGYSFSESDYQIRYLFNRAFAVRNGKKWNKVAVVNLDVEKYSPTYNRYKKFFGEIKEFPQKVSDYMVENFSA